MSSKNAVRIADLEGPALTKAVRIWAELNGHEVPARGAVPMALVVQAVTSGATIDPEALETGTTYVLTDKDGKAHKVRGTSGKATLDGLAERIGLAPEEVATVTRDGALFALPRRASGPAVAPWTVTYRDEEGGTATAPYVGNRGRLSVYEVAATVEVHPARIVSVARDGVVWAPEVTFKFVKVEG